MPAAASAQSVRQAAPGIVLLARVGYAAKAVVFIVVGVLAARMAVGRGGGTTDQRGALQVIGQGPFGTVALVAMAIGLFGYLAWRIVAAVTDAERKGDAPSKIVVRIASAARGLAYGLLGVQAVRELMHRGGGAGQQKQAAHWTARLMELPFGRVLVLAAGLGFIGYAAYQLYRASSQKRVRKHLNLGEAGYEGARWIVRFGQFGIAARAVVFALVGVFLLRAARDYDPGKAGGLQESLSALAQAPYGRYVLGTVALGLIAYGAYQLATARYRQMRAV
jgi:hypothetical protein